MKVVLAVIIIAIIGLLFWMLDWQGKQATLVQIDKTLEEKRADKERMENDVKKIDELVKINNDLKQQLKEVVKTGFTPEKEQEFVANYIETIEALINKVAVEDNDPSFKLNSLTPGQQQTQAAPAAKGGEKGAGDKGGGATVAVPPALSNYPTRTFQMAMHGRYETLIDFLDRLGRLELKRLVTVNKISLAPEGKTNTGSPVLSITLPLTAYLRTGGGE
jgi:Tfp pilus assembly protein PilO